MNSPFAHMYLSIMDKIKAAVPAVKHINQDLGQLELYELRPSVAFPCVLIDVDEFKFTQVGGKNHQLAEGVVMIRLATAPLSTSHHLAPTAVTQKALEFYEIEWGIYKALQGWAPTNMGKLSRVAAKSERRDDALRVRVLIFSVSFTDTSAAPIFSSIETPAPAIMPELS